MKLDDFFCFLVSDDSYHPYTLFKLESFFNIIFAVILQTAIFSSRYCSHASC